MDRQKDAYILPSAFIRKIFHCFFSKINLTLTTLEGQ